LSKEIKINYTSGILLITYQVNFITVKVYGYTFRLMPANLYPLQALCANVLYITNWRNQPTPYI